MQHAVSYFMEQCTCIPIDHESDLLNIYIFFSWVLNEIEVCNLEGVWEKDLRMWEKIGKVSGHTSGQCGNFSSFLFLRVFRRV